jgi:hypothetical protein
MTSHSSPREDARRVGAGTNRAWLAVNTLRTMAGWLTPKVVTTHCTRKATTASHTDDVHEVDAFQRRRLQNITNLQPVSIIAAAKLANPSLWLTVGLRSSGCAGFAAATVDCSDMATSSTSGFAASLVSKAELHSVVTVPLYTAHLQHHARPSLDDRNGLKHTVAGVHLSHSDFSSQQSD